MKSFVLIGVLTLTIAGCHREPGAASGILNVGGEAKLVSSDGSDITLETFGAPAAGKTSRRSTKTSKVERSSCPRGHRPRPGHRRGRCPSRDQGRAGAGSIYWVECSRLRPSRMSGPPAIPGRATGFTTIRMPSMMSTTALQSRG